MTSGLRRSIPALFGYVEDRAMRWRTGARDGQRTMVLWLTLLTVLLLLSSLLDYELVPVSVFAVPLVLGFFLLQPGSLIRFGAVVTGAAVATTFVNRMGTDQSDRVANLVVVFILYVLGAFIASRQRSGLPGVLGELMLADLNDRLQRQGTVPTLPAGWSSQSAMVSAGGTRFAGDFLVANVSDDQRHLEMILVDVCGKGVSAGTQSLQFAGALGGLIGSLPPLGLFAAANDYLLRQAWEDGFATAVHVLVNLDTGDYSIISAGHPPAMAWHADDQTWDVDVARGTALGILDLPEFQVTSGRLAPGDALMFYTDGVIERRDRDLGSGIDWLRELAAGEVAESFDQAPRRILKHVPDSDDDRAILIVHREG